MAVKQGESKSFLNLGVVLNNKNEVLMIRRVKKETGTDNSILEWAFPAGKQKYEETREECVKREVLAETGYAVKPIKQIDLKKHPQFPVMIAYHLCLLENPEPVAEIIEKHEVREIKWVKPSEIKNLITTELNKKVQEELKLK